MQKQKIIKNDPRDTLRNRPLWTPLNVENRLNRPQTHPPSLLYVRTSVVLSRMRQAGNRSQIM